MTSQVVNLIIAVLILTPSYLYAAEFSSTNFKIIDPVISVGGGNSSSNSFEVESSIGQPGGSGSLTSASYELGAGFLYFASTPPASPSPSPSPTPAASPPGDGVLETLINILNRPLSGPLAALIPQFKDCSSPLLSDFNCDDKVNIVDLSYLLYLSSKPAPNPADLNKDRVIDPKDLSMLLSNWTGEFLTFVPDGRAVKMVEHGGDFYALEKAPQNLAFAGRDFSERPETAGAPYRATETRTGSNLSVFILLFIFLIVFFAVRVLLF